MYINLIDLDPEKMRKAYSVDEHGIVKAPGKFQAEHWSIIWFYDLAMNGFADDQGDGWYAFDMKAISSEELELWPEGTFTPFSRIPDAFSELSTIKGRELVEKYIAVLTVDDQGFWYLNWTARQDFDTFLEKSAGREEEGGDSEDTLDVTGGYSRLHPFRAGDGQQWVMYFGDQGPAEFLRLCQDRPDPKDPHECLASYIRETSDLQYTQEDINALHRVLAHAISLSSLGPHSKE